MQLISIPKQNVEICNHTDTFTHKIIAICTHKQLHIKFYVPNLLKNIPEVYEFFSVISCNLLSSL